MKDPSLEDTNPNPLAPSGGDPQSDVPAAASVSIEAAGLTDRGCKRESNQDHFLVARAGRYLETISTSLPGETVFDRYEEAGHVLLVADGMGGAAGGETASRVAIGTLLSIAQDLPDWIMKVDDESAAEIQRRAVKFYRQIHATLAEQARAEPNLSGMGTTMTCARSAGSTLFVTHVGDSRAYLHRDGKLTQLTTDHTMVQELVDSGMLTREEAATNRLRHVLTNVLGGSVSDVNVDVGLTETAKDDEIADVLERVRSPETICRTLVDLALERGAPDNVTVVAGRCSSAGS